MTATACRVSRRWLVLAGAFIAVFLAIGTLKSFGLLINDMTRDLQTSTAMLGLGIGLWLGLSNILAIINVPLMKKFSARQLMIVGSLIGCLGMIFSSFCQSGAHFVWTMGISGAGFSIVFFPCHTCCTLDYFPDAFEKAVSVMLTGGGLGMMLLPLLVKLLHDAYGWRGVITILGALNLNFIVVGALMKPVKTRKLAGKETTGVVEGIISKEGYLEVKQNPGDVSTVMTERGLSVSVVRKKDVALVECNELTGKKWTDEADLESEIQNDREILTSNVIYDLEKSTDTCSGCDGDSINCETHLHDDSASLTICHSLYAFVKNLFDLRLFIENPTFIFPVVVYFLFGITNTCWIVFVIPNAVAKGYTTAESSFLATTGGAANIVGRFATGFISSHHFVHEEVFCCLIFLTAAAAFFCNTFASSFWSLVMLSLMNGFSSGANLVMGSLIAKKILPIYFVSTGMCYLFLSQGLGGPVGGAIMGNFYDQNRSYVLAFNVAALIEFLSAVLIVCPLFLRWCKSKTRRGNSNSQNLEGLEDARETVL